MKSYLYTIFMALASLTFAACGSDNFSIEGQLTDAGTQNLRFVYLSGEKIHSQWIPSVGGAFSMQGNSKELTVVYIYSSKMKFLTHIAIKNGETVKLHGTIADNYGITAEGGEINTEWNAFIRNHSEAFTKNDQKRTDKAIEDFVKANPGNIVSTLLLTCDYAGKDFAKLIETVDASAKPEQITTLYANDLQNLTEKEIQIAPFSLYDDNDSLMTFDIKKNACNVLYFWFDSKDKRHAEYVKKIKTIDDKSVKVSDIYLNYDTTDWRTTLKKDSTNWKHYRTFAGAADKSIDNLNVKGANFIIVADSTGKQLYRGQSADEALSAIKNLKR